MSRATRPLRRVRGADRDQLAAALRALPAAWWWALWCRPAQLRRCLLGLPVSARAAAKILAAVCGRSTGRDPGRATMPGSDVQTAYQGPSDDTDAPPKRGGPERCQRPCVECPEGNHHFADPMIDFAGEEGAEDTPTRREALAAGCDGWFVCKHCPAWLEVTDETLDGPEEEDIDDGVDGDILEGEDEAVLRG